MFISDTTILVQTEDTISYNKSNFFYMHGQTNLNDEKPYKTSQLDCDAVCVLDYCI